MVVGSQHTWATDQLPLYISVAWQYRSLRQLSSSPPNDVVSLFVFLCPPFLLGPKQNSISCRLRLLFFISKRYIIDYINDRQYSFYFDLRIWTNACEVVGQILITMRWLASLNNMRAARRLHSSNSCIRPTDFAIQNSTPRGSNLAPQHRMSEF